jgi:putative transposase
VRAKAKRRALDWQRKVTHALAQESGVVGVEDLDITGMVRSARGTVEAPGANVAQKSGWNRATATQAWGRTVTSSAYKPSERGGHLVRVPAPYTSRRCSRCRVIAEGSRESRDRFVCKAPGCGYTARTPTPTPRATSST